MVETLVSSFHLKGIGGHKKRPSARIRQQRGNYTNHHRHESKEQKRNDYLQRQFIQGRIETTEDRPIPLIDIGEKRITELIKSVTGQYEDSFQDAWLKVLEDHAGTEDDVLRIAKEICKNHTKEAFTNKIKTRSLQAPIAKSEEEGEELTLESVLPSKDLSITDDEIDAEIDSKTPYLATSTGKINVQGSRNLDRETVVRLKSMFPHDTLNVAIRKAVGLGMPERDKTPWYKWEDAIIRARYPWGGSLACSMDIHRSPNAINKRAQFLKIRAGKSLFVNPDLT